MLYIKQPIKYRLIVTLMNISIFFFLYTFLLLSDTRLYSIPNLFLLLISILFIYIGYIDLKKYKFSAFNLFMIIYFSTLLFNLLTLSNAQEKKTWEDVYYFLFVPLITLSALYYTEHIKVSTIKLKIFKFNANSLAIFLLILFLLLKGYIFYTKGIKLIDFMNGKFFLDEATYIVPTITGLSNVLFWFLIISLFYVNKKMKFIIIIITTTIAILNVKRGDIIRELIYLILSYIYLNKYRLNKKIIKKVISFILLMLLAFTYLGEIRQDTRSKNFNINTQIEAKVNNTMLNWIYGYTAMNYDISKKYIDDERPKLMYPFVVLQPITNLIGYKENIVEYYKDTWNYRINGFNAAPYFALFIHDMGGFYFIEGFLYSTILALLILLTKVFQSEGTYVYILMLISFSFFGPYLFNPQMFYTVLIGIFFTQFIKQKAK